MRIRSTTVKALGLSLGVALLAGAASGAEENEAALLIEPGFWLFKLETQMLGEVTPQESTLCITNPRISPEAFMQNVPEEAGCKLKDLEAKGNSMSWSIRCRSREGKAKGSGEFTSTGKALSGTFEFTLTSRDGTSLGIDSSWTGELLKAECPAGALQPGQVPEGMTPPKSDGE